MHVGGFVCPGDERALIVRPKDAGDTKYPLISFGHGWLCGGDETDIYYNHYLSALASSGFVVIASLSAPTQTCFDEDKD